MGPVLLRNAPSPDFVLETTAPLFLAVLQNSDSALRGSWAFPVPRASPWDLDLHTSRGWHWGSRMPGPS